jgi:predicted nucleic acid-binding protein
MSRLARSRGQLKLPRLLAEFSDAKAPAIEDCHVLQSCDSIGRMPSVNIRELRDTRRLKAWLRSGKTVELGERSEVISGIIRAHVQTPNEHWPDLPAGGRRFSESGPIGSGPADRGTWTLLSIYADTSFFVSLCLPDRYSAEAEHRMTSKPQLWLTPLHIAEWTHAVSQHVFRKEISLHEARQAHDGQEFDRINGVWLEADLPESFWKTCTDLARKHGPKLGIRALDSLHVASALEFGAKAFWTFDERQAKLAAAVGLPTS